MGHPPTGFVPSRRSLRLLGSAASTSSGIPERSRTRHLLVGDFCRSRQRVGFQPELASNDSRLDPDSRPPFDFRRRPVQFPMMGAAERNRELVTDLLSKPSRLREPQMM